MKLLRKLMVIQALALPSMHLAISPSCRYFGRQSRALSIIHDFACTYKVCMQERGKRLIRHVPR